jgi:L-ascorbate metabolism protein UlaG (beta-lactamase superfamily)
MKPFNTVGTAVLLSVLAAVLCPCSQTFAQSNCSCLVHPDFNGDTIVDFLDFALFAQGWPNGPLSYDIAPAGATDKIVNFKDLAGLTDCWLKDYTQLVYITWLAHASVKIHNTQHVVYVDPRNLSITPHDATLVLVTHQHTDHYSAADIAKVSGPSTPLVVAAKVVATYGTGQAIAPWQTFDLPGLHVIAVPSYNINKTNHPKSDNLLGFIIELGGKRVYVAGDTDLIPEMSTLGEIDVAFLPAGGTYTMNATEAAQAATIIKPTLAIPYHWGTSVGTLADAQLFARTAGCNAKVMTSGESICSDDWTKDYSIVAHWPLDETIGTIAHEIVADKFGTCYGDPNWLPTAGQIAGALAFDGINDYIAAPFILNPSQGAFSVFAWVKTGTPGGVVISQWNTEGLARNWLRTEQGTGKLMTELKGTGRDAAPLISQTVITDDLWHRVGFVWDGARRYLYVDGVEVAKDATAQTALEGALSGLYIGAANNRAAGAFWSGLIDDIRIHSRAVHP